MSEKVCTMCLETKDETKDFYRCSGYFRSECKACTVRRNVRYQRKVQAWKNRFVDGDERRSYMIEYYAKNKEKFAEYRKKFKEKYPDYYRNYFHEHKKQK